MDRNHFAMPVDCATPNGQKYLVKKSQSKQLNSRVFSTIREYALRADVSCTGHFWGSGMHVYFRMYGVFSCLVLVILFCKKASTIVGISFIVLHSALYSSCTPLYSGNRLHASSHVIEPLESAARVSTTSSILPIL